MANTNMTIYNKFRSVPQEAQKTIAAGKLKGFTDINPMWRIKMLTEQFGSAGEGWCCKDVKMWKEDAVGESAAFCSLNLYVKVGNEWSEPIFGIGGSKLSGKGVGDGINDEAFKMAFTDALSIACKNLGMAADIYFANDRTKYNSVVETPTKPIQVAKPKVCDKETYWKIVAAFAEKKPTKSGGDYRSTWINEFKPTPEMVERFDMDVENYIAARNV